MLYLDKRDMKYLIKTRFYSTVYVFLKEVICLYVRGLKRDAETYRIFLSGQ